MKQKAFTIALLVLMSTAFLMTVNLSVQGQSLNGVSITQFTVAGLAVTNSKSRTNRYLGGHNRNL